MNVKRFASNVVILESSYQEGVSVMSVGGLSGLLGIRVVAKLANKPVRVVGLYS
jgi:hypothetical protein